MSAPQVSIVMPVFNAVTVVSRAMASVLRQTFEEWELIAVDDGSTDGTLELLHSLAKTEPRVRVLTIAHGGIVAALNTGLATARAPFVARMDADDEASPERLTEQVALLRARPELGLVGSLVEFGGDRQAQAGYALHVDWLNSLATPKEIELNRFVESPFAHPSVLFRRSLVESHGGYRDGDFPEDYELWLRWLEAGVAMAKVPRVLLKWNDPPQRLSRIDPRYDPKAFYRCKAGYLARWLARHAGPSRRVFVWGAGRPTRVRAEHLSAHGVRIAGYIDIDPRKLGRSFSGRPVIAPQDLPPATECFVLGYVGKRGARELVREHLRQRDFREGRDFLMAA